jgi:hypothetical protein
MTFKILNTKTKQIVAAGLSLTKSHNFIRSNRHLIRLPARSPRGGGFGLLLHRPRSCFSNTPSGSGTVRIEPEEAQPTARVRGGVEGLAAMRIAGRPTFREILSTGVRKFCPNNF